MSSSRSPFDVLGVTPLDDMTTIRMAWRAKVRVLHPDHAKNKAVATVLLAEVNAAFDSLQGHRPKKPAKRRRQASPDDRAKAQQMAAEKRRADAAERGRRRAHSASTSQATTTASKASPKRKSPQMSPKVQPVDAPLRRMAAAGYSQAQNSIKAA